MLHRARPGPMFDTQEWLSDAGALHRDGDLPAKIITFHDTGAETREWWSHGLRHRAHDLPAVCFWTGRQEWWVRGVRHREGGFPAVVHVDGTAEFWFEGHRRKA